MVGTWDPLVPATAKLFKRFRTRAGQLKLTPLIIIITPHPVHLLHARPQDWPHYACARARASIIRQVARVHTLIVEFRYSDLAKSAEDFFDFLSAHVNVSGLWLGANQSFGRGKEGSQERIICLCRSRRISLSVLRRDAGQQAGSSSIISLRDGDLETAASHAIHPPIWKRPRSGILMLYWPPGRYVVYPIDKPSATPITTGPSKSVIVPRPGPDGKTLLRWPFSPREKWLAFKSGPKNL
jgi:hypothetical protein